MKLSFSEGYLRSFFPLLLLSAIAFSACQPKEVTSAKIYIKNGEWERALVHLESAVELHPDNPEAHFLLGQAYGRRGHFEKMNHQFDISLKLSDKFQPHVFSEREKHWIDKYNAGIVQFGLGQYREAKSFFMIAIQIDSTRLEAHKKMAVTHLNMDRPRKALKLYNRLLSKKPDDIELLASTANLYYSQKKYHQVIPILEKILKFEPEHRDALANLALTYDSLGEKEKAAAAYQAAIKVNPEDKDLIFLFAIHHYKRQQFEQAIQLFEHVLNIDPDDLESISNIGNAYLSMAEALRVKLKSSKNSVDAIASIQQLKEDAILNYKNAIPYLEKSLNVEPNQPSLLRNLGAAYINTGQKERGEQAFLKAEELKVKSIE